MKYPTIILFGPPGSGKGTQAKLLSSSGKYVHFNTGEMCRSHDSRSPLGRQIKELMDKGNLIPDEMIVDLLKQSIIESDYNPETQIILLDGIPRTPNQVRMISDFIDVQKIITLEIPEEEMVRRLLKRADVEGRADDSSEEIIANRIKVYKEQTESVLVLYEPGIVKRVNGVGSVEEIHSLVLQALENTA